MANDNKKLVEAITPMEEDFAQWYRRSKESRAYGLFKR